MDANQERLEENLRNPVVLLEWDITSARRYARIFKVVHLVAIVAMTVAMILYLMFGGHYLVTTRVSGFVAVLALAYVTSILRFFQIKAELADIPKFTEIFAKNLNGQDEHDMGVQEALEQQFVWPCRHYQIIERMAGLTMLVVLCINTAQLGHLDLWRTVCFDLAILTFLMGSLWNNFTFRAAFLYAELEERLKASLAYRDAHPEEFEEEPEDEYSDDEIDFSGPSNS